jgi:hypothetical protein
MRKILLSLIVFINSVGFAQNKSEIKAFFWGDLDSYKSTTTVPEKWKDESAVIIYRYEFYDYHKFGKNVTYTTGVRKRIKLQDAAAVKEFSEFSFKDKFRSNKGFSGKEATNTLGVKIIKPQGKEIEIDVEKESKEVDNQKKIAISNLEIGDVLDFYFYSVEPFKTAYELGFEPVETTLGEVYPTLDLKITFQTENDFFVNFNTYNGAPALQEIPTSKSNERIYELQAKDIDKNEFPRWFYPLAEMPCYKFQVFFARSGKFEKRADAFLSEKESIIKKEVSKEDVFNYYNDKFRPSGNLGPIEDFLKGKKFASDQEEVQEVYYFARHKFFTQFIEASAVTEAKLFYADPYYLADNPIFLFTQESFINYFMAFLKDNKIDYDIVVGTGRYNGTIDDLLIQKNATILLRVNTEKPVYLEYFSPFTSADLFDFNLENTKAYVLQVSKRKKVTDVETLTLPASTAKENLSKIIYEIIPNEDLTNLKVKRESSFEGHLKEEEQNEKLYFYNYVYEDYQKYGTKPLLERVKNKKDKEKYQKEFDALINKIKDKQKANFKENINKEFGFEIEDHTLEIKNTGRFGSKTPMVCEEAFTIKNNLIKKAGDNYIIEIGKMITSQIEIDKKEKERKNSIYLTFPRTFQNEIVFTIPEGYTVSGLEKLNKNITNDTGGFTSNAVVEGNKLIIKTNKFYNNYYEPNSNWSKMILFLDAAYQFTQEKILLKKN